MFKTFYLPDLGEGLTSAEIKEWFVHSGDSIEAEETLCTVETAKALVEVPSPFSGVITKTFADNGETVATGGALCTIEETSLNQTEEGQPAEPRKDEAATVVGKLSNETNILKTEKIIQGGDEKTNNVKIMPALRTLAIKHGINIDEIKGTGPDGTIMLADLPLGSKRQFNLSGLSSNKKAMFEMMAQTNEQIMQTTITDLLTIKEKKDLTSTLIQALVSTLNQHPLFNAQYCNTHGLVHHDDINIGIAVYENDNLFVPVIKDCGSLKKTEIKPILEIFKQRAQKSSFSQEDLADCRFVFSNFGTIGAGLYGTPVVVPPGLAIIATGTLITAPSWDDQSKEWQPVLQLPISLTFDHRLINGAEASEFIKTLKSHM